MSIDRLFIFRGWCSLDYLCTSLYSITVNLKFIFAQDYLFIAEAKNALQVYISDYFYLSKGMYNGGGMI